MSTRERDDQQREHRAAGDRDRAQIGMLGEHGGARNRRGHDQRIAGRLIVRDDRIAVHGRAFVLVERRRDQRALVQHDAHHRLARRLARQAVGQEDIRRDMSGEQQRVAGALPADAQRALTRLERQDDAEEHAVVGGRAVRATATRNCAPPAEGRQRGVPVSSMTSTSLSGVVVITARRTASGSISAHEVSRSAPIAASVAIDWPMRHSARAIARCAERRVSSVACRSI